LGTLVYELDFVPGASVTITDSRRENNHWLSLDLQRLGIIKRYSNNFGNFLASKILNFHEKYFEIKGTDYLNQGIFQSFFHISMSPLICDYLFFASFPNPFGLTNEHKTSERTNS